VIHGSDLAAAKRPSDQENGSQKAQKHRKTKENQHRKKADTKTATTSGKGNGQVVPSD
jgi:hypothetical protein